MPTLMGMKLSNVDTWGPIEASIVARARLMNLAEEHNGNVLFDDEAVTQKIIQRADKLNDKVTKDPSLKPFLDLHVREGLRLQELDKRFKHHYDASKRKLCFLQMRPLWQRNAEFVGASGGTTERLSFCMSNARPLGLRTWH